MAIIKSGATTDQWTIDPTSKAGRVTLYAPDGTPIYKNRTRLFRGSASAFRTLGTGATPQNLFSIENQTGSTVTVAVKSLVFVADFTAVLVAQSCQVDVSRPTAVPTGGTTLTKIALDSTLSSSGNVVVRGATASDGGVATAITATAGSLAWRTFMNRLQTLAGYVDHPQMNLLPLSCLDEPILLAANTALLVQITGTGTSNAATNHYLASIQWDEY